MSFLLDGNLNYGLTPPPLPLPPPPGIVAPVAFLTADLAFVIALRIALLADDFACDDAAEREPDIEFFIVFPCSVVNVS